MNNHSNGKMSMFYLYSRYERFWHWLQAALIVCLLVTGFEVHGSFTLLGFKRAVTVHAWVGVAWLVAFAFFVFWVATTGEWKQYVPTTKKMFEVMRFYAYGIFMGWPHPCPKTPDAKHNPLQRLTYLALAAILLPFMMATGLLYYVYNDWAGLGLGGLSLSAVALAHIIGAFAILIFLVVHIYMTTTGHTPFTHIRAMITGWEEEKADVPEDWEKRTA
ncbi:cytochrome b/b6 domain-containing protein [Solidesulfovibrio sp.]|jgi:thiosulfate reductase cytochrome b subunit|uniref:cytochrome b/b6 domain-containing protein n=1 Tax=Solidesulfovibrio sp. TaxID=2910990 RepID=UPI000EC612F6|nr:cytochrome b/b6 domain-containing protein [Solidesulfovibrio sp.]MEA5087458.1 cytochrome b/b6 domain-containing protein [Solidesulfovibrio sp.]HCR12539.1 cytochrome B [Desulfovibrio sp.]HML60649.1 cytochrome b/b6 domain-containing protein [Solidesulfovibrio sp.]